MALRCLRLRECSYHARVWSTPWLTPEAPAFSQQLPAQTTMTDENNRVRYSYATGDSQKLPTLRAVRALQTYGGGKKQRTGVMSIEETLRAAIRAELASLLNTKAYSELAKQKNSRRKIMEWLRAVSPQNAGHLEQLLKEVEKDAPECVPHFLRKLEQGMRTFQTYAELRARGFKPRFVYDRGQLAPRVIIDGKRKNLKPGARTVLPPGPFAEPSDTEN
jgi:hypothetical protein